jgi:hypothetical protein
MLLLLVTPAGLPASGNPFDGDWDITVESPGRPRAWWLHIEGAGSGRPSGTFSTAYDGKLNPIDELSIEGDRLRFACLAKRAEGRITRFEYGARLVDGKLRGDYRVGGQNRVAATWTGVRAPVLDEKDDGSWRRGKPVSLFNGKDLSGWRQVAPGTSCCWSATGGLLTTAGKGSDLASEAAFWNFEMHMQYRLATGSNSGVGLRGRYELQIKDDPGVPPAINCSGAIYSRIAPEANAGKRAGEWQDLRVRLVGRQVTVVLNGKMVIRRGRIDGLTAIAIDADQAKPGPFVLQGDHGAAEFRNMTVTPLVQRTKEKTR